MSACRFVGRVGGLAVALGVGAALYSGVAVASADTGSAASVSAGPATSRTSSAPARANKPAATQTKRAIAAPAAVTVSVKPTTSGGKAPATTDTRLDWTVMAYSRRASLTAGRTAAAAATLTTPEILGPSGVPIPSQEYVAKVMNYYIRPEIGAPQPPYLDPQPQVVFTPEGLYPITGVKSLPLNVSVDQGIEILYDTLDALPQDTPTTVFGYSQSAIISGLLQSGYTTAAGAQFAVPDKLADSIDFVLVGNELNPNGGLLSRFTAFPANQLPPTVPALTLPSLGLNFYGATPENAYPTTNYTLEYDGFADFPRYPLNFLSVLNAGLGLAYVHTKYAPGSKCQTYCTTFDQVVNAIQLPVSPGSIDQNYFFMPTENLPLLQPIRMIPLIGNPIADLIQPVLKVIVDLGYADPAHGFASGVQPYANQLVPFGLFPQVDPLEVVNKLVSGIGQGIADFVNDFTPSGSIARELSSFQPPSLSSLNIPLGETPLTTLQLLITGVVDTISNTAASLYSALLPTADIINAITTALPAYNVSLFIGGIKQALNGDLIGGLINAIGLPIAANVGLVTTASLVGALVWAQAVAGVFSYTVGA